MGLSMAQLRAQPRATHSLAFSVLLGSWPNTSRMRARREGTLLLLPTISTEEMSPLLRPDSSSAYSHAKAIH